MTINSRTVHPVTAGLAGLFVGAALGISGGGWLAVHAADYPGTTVALTADSPHAGTGAAPGPATINVSEFGNIDAIPTCAVEDCSDQPGQIGLWRDGDTGNWWFSTGDTSSALVIDNTGEGVR